MSGRYDSRRRDYDDRDRGGRYPDRGAPPRRDGRSRSRSPRRGGGDRDRRGPIPERRDYRDDRRDAGRDRDRDRDVDRRRDDRDRRDHRDERRERREPPPRREADREREREPAPRGERREEAGREPSRAEEKRPALNDERPRPTPPVGSAEPTSRQGSEMLVDEAEEGEAMDAVNEDDAAMMAMMGLSGFGTTKGKHVDGNQEGGVDVKKMRTWRQYMNRRGGFNRPLDKIK